MFGPDYKAGCPSCSAIADGFNGIAVHLANHDVMLWAVSRAPLAKVQAYKRRMGWTFPWASSVGGDFNFDFCASYTEKQQREGIEYNFTREQWRAGHEGGGEGVEVQFAAMCGIDAPTYGRERPGMSAFALEDGVAYHTYSTYARGLDGLWGMYPVARPRWPPRGSATKRASEWRYHDRYAQLASSKRRLMLPRGGGARVNTRQCCQTATRDRDNARRPALRWSRGDEIAGCTVSAIPGVSPAARPIVWPRLSAKPSKSLPTRIPGRAVRQEYRCIRALRWL